LGLGLLRAGYDVRVATHAIHREFVTGHGLGFADVEGDPREIMERDAGQAWLESGSNPLRFMREFTRLAGPLADKLLADAWEACRDADAIVISTLGFPGYHVAEKTKVPCFSAPLQPLTRTRAFPSLSMPVIPALGGGYNWATHFVTEQLFWQFFREPVNRWRRESLGLPPTPFKGPFDRLYEERLPFIYGYSPTVIPKPADWPDCHHVTGYWFLNAPPDWQPPAALLDFLQSGPPPVYIGFGSMSGRTAQQLAETAVEAVTRAKQRAILLGGWAEVGHRHLPDHIFRVNSIPHDWLFPRVAAVVHHGGAGTTAAGLRAGVPSILTPLFADQPFWGERVAQLGVGPQPIPRKQLTPERLAAAITTALADKDMRARAAALGEKIRAEDGVARAVEIIERHLGALPNEFGG
jgi:UDP:flavonoid glycosyltransferase YjiC (YdhE family)